MTSKGVNRLFLCMIVIYLGASFLLQDLFRLLPTTTALVISQGIIIIPALVYCCIYHIPIKEAIQFHRIHIGAAALVVVFTLFMYPLLIVINAISLLFVESGMAGTMEELSDAGFILSTITIAMLPALVEEFVFRGMLFQTYKRSRMLAGIFLSSFLFGCMHMNLNQFLYAFLLGICMAFLVEATGSIISSMLAHFTINFTSFATFYATQRMAEFSGITENNPGLQTEQTAGMLLSTMDSETSIAFLMSIVIWLGIAIFTTAGAVGVFIGICNISGRWEHIKGMFRTGNRERILSIPLLIAILIMVVFIILGVIL